MLAVVQHQQQLLVAQERDERLLQRHARPGASPRTPPPPPRPPPSGSRTAASSHSHAPSGNRGSTSAATCNARRVLPTPPTPVNVTTRTSRHRVGDPDQLRLTADERGQLAGRLPGNASNDRNGGNAPESGREPGTPATGRAGPAAGAHPDRRGHPPAGSRASRRSPANTHLAAVRDRHQAGRPVHLGPEIVTVPLLGLAGLHPHPHPQHRPAATPHPERRLRLDGGPRASPPRRTPPRTRPRRRETYPPRPRCSRSDLVMTG